jgi:hypothetical protein
VCFQLLQQRQQCRRKNAKQQLARKFKFGAKKEVVEERQKREDPDGAVPLLRQAVQLSQQAHPRCPPAQGSLSRLRQEDGQVVPIGTHEDSASGQRSAHQGRLLKTHLHVRFYSAFSVLRR